MINESLRCLAGRLMFLLQTEALVADRHVFPSSSPLTALGPLLLRRPHRNTYPSAVLLGYLIERTRSVLVASVARYKGLPKRTCRVPFSRDF